MFVGTRVPAAALFDHLRRGYTVEYFLAQFPTVTREQVHEVLKVASEGRSWSPPSAAPSRRAAG